MKRRKHWIRDGGLLGSGLVLGLAVGAWRWRGAEDGPVAGPSNAPVAIGRPPTISLDSQRTASGGRTAERQVNGTPDRVLAAAIKVRGLRESGRMMAYTELMAALGVLHADECARLLQTLAESGEWDAESAAYPLLHWATLDPAAALAFALAHKDFQSSERVIAEMVFALAKTDLDSSLLLLSRLKGEEREAAQIAIVNALGETDFNGALAQARAFSNPKAESAVFEAWARRDPRAAAAAFNPASIGLGNAARAIAENLRRVDSGGFDSWASTLSDPGTRGSALCIPIYSDIESNPTLAARKFAEWLATDPEAATPAVGLASELAERWVRRHNQESTAASWASTLPEGTVREAAIGAIGEHWVSVDPANASAWLAGLPPGSGKDQAIAPLVRTLCEDEPADAFAWAREIQNGDSRRDLLRHAARSWRPVDPAAATAAIESLPVEDRAAVNEPLR